MTRHLEDELKEMFNETADRAPQLPDAETVAARARAGDGQKGEGRYRRVLDLAARNRPPRERRVLFATASVGLVAASLAASIVLAPVVVEAVRDQGATDGVPTQAAPSSSASPEDGTVTGSPSGALPTMEWLRCTVAYSPDTLAQTSSFAFDGTVTGIEPTQDVADDGTFVAVSFAVNEWYAGAGAKAVTVEMVAPDIEAFESTAPAYALGTRLLVSGGPRDLADPTRNLIAEACSGFTRYYDEATAEVWAGAYR